MLSRFSIEPNPNNVLSCYVSWTTDVPAASEVDFGAGTYEFRIADVAETSEHRVLVIGMHAETAYQIKAVSKNAGGSAEAEGIFTTEALPSLVPVAEVSGADPTLAEPGWTLTNITHSGNPAPPAVVVMYDAAGLPVWYFIDGTAPDTMGDIDTRLLPDHRVLVSAVTTAPAVEVDLGGNVLWTGPAQPGRTNANMSHHLERLANGNYLGLRSYVSSVMNLTGTVVEEMTPALDVVYSWKVLDHVTPGEMPAMDFCHGNSITMDLPNDVFYLSCRNLGQILKVRHSGDQSVLWKLGKDGDFTFDPPDSGFEDLHDPEYHSDGTVLLYDNGGFNARPGPDDHSRVVEYQLDETAMTAKLVWEFPGSFDVDPWYTDEWYTAIWGDADLLPNGNILITAGTRDQGKQTRIFEVRPKDGVIVWQLTLPLANGAGYGAYRAERIVPPLVETIAGP